MVQEKAGEQRTDDPALQRAFRPLIHGAVRTLHRGAKPPRNVQPHPCGSGQSSRGGFAQQ
jgi:hypothetical protein